MGEISILAAQSLLGDIRHTQKSCFFFALNQMVEEELLAEGLWVIGWLAQVLFTVYFHFTCESVS